MSAATTRGGRRLLATLALLLACAVAPVAGQELDVCGLPYDASDPRAWAAIEARHADDLRQGRTFEVYRAVLDEFESSILQSDVAVRRRFVDTANRVGQSLGRGCPYFEIDKGAVLAPRLTLFAGDETIDLDAMCSAPGGPVRANEIRYYAKALEEICLREGAEDVRALRERIARLDETWDRFLFEGYPMFPWEAAVNGWGMRDDEIAKGPPRALFVLLHPAPAVTLGTRTFRDAEPDLALAVDLVGWVRYRAGSEYRKWWGFTILAGVANDRGTGLGLGAIYGPMRLGVVYYDDDASGSLTSERPSVIVGIDLYKYLGEQYRKYEKIRARIEEGKKKL